MRRQVQSVAVRVRHLWMQGCLSEHSMHDAATHSTCLVSQQRLLCVRDLPEQHPGVLVAGYNLHFLHAGLAFA